MDARRTLIGDSALQVIAASGIRGLTHHAVDAEAGLAKGSTSYYCRKRVDLLALALTRLYEVDRADFQELAESLESGPTRDEVLGAVAGFVVAWLTGEARARTIARLELFMAASHEPELQDLLGQQVSGMTSIASAIAAAGDGTAPPEVPLATVMLAEGIMLAVVRQGLPTPSVADVVRLLGSVVP